MSKSLPLLIDTSKAITLNRDHSAISSSSSSTSSSSTVSQPSVTPPISEPTETSSVKTTKLTTTITTTPSNIKVILAGHHQKISTINSVTKQWSNTAIKIEATCAIFISFLLFLVICSIFSMKRNRKSLSECDKAKLIDNDAMNNSSTNRTSESTEFLTRYHQQTIHV